MLFTDDYRVYGNLAVSERALEPGTTHRLTADVAILALGWESRCVAVDQHIDLDVKQVLLLDFGHAAEADPAIEANRVRVMAAARRWGAEVHEVSLASSIQFSPNIHTLEVALSEIARKVGGYHGSLRRVFVDCSTMPRVYIQWIIAHAFIVGSIHALDFGYAEGIYSNADPLGFSSVVDRYETVPLLHGSGGMGEEKLLLVGIGGDVDMFYGLIDVFSPERVALLVPRSGNKDFLDGLLDQQVAKATQMYRLEQEEIRDIPAFGLHAHLEALQAYSASAGERAVISVFVGGPKVQAIAAAVFGCQDRRVQVKARVPKGYARRDVMPGGRYRVYRLIDLTSPACSLLDTW